MPYPLSLTPPAAELISIVTRFNQALNEGDLEGMLALLSEDTVFENTFPAPDGQRFEGRAQVGRFWADFLRGSQQAHIDVEEIFAAGERCVMRWTYRWVDAQGAAGHVRGVDVYRLRGGLIVEKLSYVKG